VGVDQSAQQGGEPEPDEQGTVGSTGRGRVARDSPRTQPARTDVGGELVGQVQLGHAGVYNLVTKRAKAEEGATMEWVDGNLGIQGDDEVPVWVPRTVSRSLISAFMAGRPRRHRLQAAQHDRPLWPSDSHT